MQYLEFNVVFPSYFLSYSAFCGEAYQEVKVEDIPVEFANFGKEES